MRGAQEILNSYWCPVIIGDACNQYDKKAPASMLKQLKPWWSQTYFRITHVVEASQVHKNVRDKNPLSNKIINPWMNYVDVKKYRQADTDISSVSYTSKSAIPEFIIFW